MLLLPITVNQATWIMASPKFVLFCLIMPTLFDTVLFWAVPTLLPFLLLFWDVLFLDFPPDFEKLMTCILLFQIKARFHVYPWNHIRTFNYVLVAVQKPFSAPLSLFFLSVWRYVLLGIFFFFNYSCYLQCFHPSVSYFALQKYCK